MLNKQFMAGNRVPHIPMYARHMKIIFLEITIILSNKHNACRIKLLFYNFDYQSVRTIFL